MNEQIIDILKYGIWIVFGSGFVLELSPVKINPLSSLLGWIGKRLNKDVKNDISQMKLDMKSVKSELQDHIIQSQRRNILNFADELMRAEKKSKENFDNIISIHDRYNKFIEENELENGQVNLAFDYISAIYKDCLINNSFL